MAKPWSREWRKKEPEGARGPVKDKEKEKEKKRGKKRRENKSEKKRKVSG